HEGHGLRAAGRAASALSATGAATAALVLGAGGRRRGDAAHIPLVAVHAGVHLLLHGADHLPVLQEVNGGFAHVVFGPEADGGAALGVAAVEFILEHRLLHFGVVLPLHRRARIEQMQVGIPDLVELFQRGDVVGDPDRTAVGGDDQVAVAGMDEHIVHRDGGQVGHELLPTAGAVGGDEQAALGADEEQVGVARVLAHRLYLAHLRQVGGDIRPGLAVVGGLVEVGTVVVVAVVVERHVGGRAAEVRGLDARHLHVALGRAGHTAGQVAHDVGEVFAAVEAQLQVAVVGADPDLARLRGRLAHLGGERAGG